MPSDIDRLIRLSDKHRFLHAGIDRTYFHHLPQGHSHQRAWPLVLILHGGGANGENAMRMADMEDLADREGFILLYPDGAAPEGQRVYTWNAGRCCAYARESNSDDAGFLAALIDFFIAQFKADPARVYAAGLSNGAMMAHRLAHDYSERIAAIAPVAGGLNIEDIEVAPTTPVSVIAFHGLLDRHAPYAGGIGEDSRYRRDDRPIREGMERWARWNGCDPDPERAQSEVWTHEVWSNGRGHSEVEFYTLPDQGHAWPGGRAGLRYGNVEDPEPSLNASDLIWKFFKSHPKT